MVLYLIINLILSSFKKVFKKETLNFIWNLLFISQKECDSFRHI